ncbi:MAG: AAA family ATPase, partial [Gammaproteobacteria bacterium]
MLTTTKKEEKSERSKKAAFDLNLRVHRQDVTLNRFNSFNVILGKNGSGKSSLLQMIRLGFHDTYYIQPERGSWLEYSEDLFKEEPPIKTMHDKVVIRTVIEDPEPNDFQKNPSDTIYLFYYIDQNKNPISPHYDIELMYECEDKALDRAFFLDRDVDKVLRPCIVKCKDGQVKMWGRKKLDNGYEDDWDFTSLESTKFSGFLSENATNEISSLSTEQLPQAIWNELVERKAHLYLKLRSVWFEDGLLNETFLEDEQYLIGFQYAFPQSMTETIIVGSENDRNFVNQIIAVTGCSFSNETLIAVNTDSDRTFRMTMNQKPDFRRRTFLKLRAFVLEYRNKAPSIIEQLESVLNRILQSICVKINVSFDKYNLDKPDWMEAREILQFFSKRTQGFIRKNEISSGENELISLVIEIFLFVYSNNIGHNRHAKKLPFDGKMLLIDEPEVHLHPDSQLQLTEWLYELTQLQSEQQPERIVVVIATHSTSILSALSYKKGVGVCFLPNNLSLDCEGKTILKFATITKELSDILPVFGVHPLSRVFNENPILLVEGEDEMRIWEQAIRTSFGALKLHPCVTGTKDVLSKYEVKTNEIVSAIYDSPVAYSLRDRDDVEEKDVRLSTVGYVIRYRLRCRASENLLLSDEVLKSENFNFEQFKDKVIGWVEVQSKLPETQRAQKTIYETMEKFSQALRQDTNNARIEFDLKEIRVLLTGLILETNKNWETIIGKVIGELCKKSILIVCQRIPQDSEVKDRTVFIYVTDKKIKYKYINISNGKVSEKVMQGEGVEALKSKLSEGHSLEPSDYEKINTILSKKHCPIFLEHELPNAGQVSKNSIFYYLGDFVHVVFPQLRTRFTSNPGASAGVFAVDQLEKNVAEIDPS